MGGIREAQTITKSIKTNDRIQDKTFYAACISILLHGCESWVLTEPLKKKLDTFARTCSRIILGFKQVEVHMKNDELYKKVSQYPIRDQIRVRQLKFTGHCLRMDKEELAFIYIFYKSEIRQNKRQSKHELPRPNFDSSNERR